MTTSDRPAVQAQWMLRDDGADLYIRVGLREMVLSRAEANALYTALHSTMRQYPMRCKRCGGMFVAKSPTSRYCSTQCAHFGSLLNVNPAGGRPPVRLGPGGREKG